MSGSFGHRTKQRNQPQPETSNTAADLVNDITIGVGSIRLNSRIIDITSPLTKRLDAVWAQGSNQGGRFPGVALSDTTYHVFVMRNSLGEVDGGFDTSITAQNAPAGWVAKRVSSIMRLSSTIRGFIQNGVYFELKDLSLTDMNNVFVPVASTLYRVSVPTGIKAMYRGHVSPGRALANTSMALVIQSPDQVPLVSAVSSFLGAFRGSLGVYDGTSYFTSESCEVQVLTNISGEVAMSRSGNYSTLSAIYGTTLQPLGWVDIGLIAGGF